MNTGPEKRPCRVTASFPSKHFPYSVKLSLHSVCAKCSEYLGQERCSSSRTEKIMLLDSS
jgi:hypothetical protein